MQRTRKPCPIPSEISEVGQFQLSPPAPRSLRPRQVSPRIPDPVVAADGFRLQLIEVKSAIDIEQAFVGRKGPREAAFLYRERDRVRARWLEPRAPIVGSSKG